MTKELKPCPFCGKQPIRELREFDAKKIEQLKKEIDSLDGRVETLLIDNGSLKKENEELRGYIEPLIEGRCPNDIDKSWYCVHDDCFSCRAYYIMEKSEKKNEPQ